MERHSVKIPRERFIDLEDHKFQFWWDVSEHTVSLGVFCNNILLVTVDGVPIVPSLDIIL